MSILMLLLQTVALANTAQVAQSIQAATYLALGGIVDVAYKLSMVAIAVFNVFYVWKLNKSQNQDKEAQRERERRADLLKTVVLIPNLKKMYRFLDRLWSELEKLKLDGENDKTVDKENTIKSEIEPKIQALFATFRSDFIIVLNATVPSLGKKMEKMCDIMRDALIKNMADPGINLWIAKYFNDKIKTVYEEGKMNMVNVLFNYNGEVE